MHVCVLCVCVFALFNLLMIYRDFHAGSVKVGKRPLMSSCVEKNALISRVKGHNWQTGWKL